MGLVMVLSYWRRVFPRFYLDTGVRNFLRGHVAVFEAWQGVPREFWYDNLTSVVVEPGETMLSNTEVLRDPSCRAGAAPSGSGAAGSGSSALGVDTVEEASYAVPPGGLGEGKAKDTATGLENDRPAILTPCLRRRAGQRGAETAIALTFGID